jgi:hypothetical protein
MSKMNLLVDLKGYEGNNANTSRTIFNKNLQHVGIVIDREITQELEIPANTVRLLFSASNNSGTTPASGPTFEQESIPLTTSQSLQYIEVDRKIIIDSLILSNGKALGFRNIDFQITFVGNKTRITWIDEWAAGGNQGLELDETIFLWYAYNSSEQGSSSTSSNSYPGIDLFKFLYVEVDKECQIIINGTVTNTIKPVVVNNVAKKGVFLISTDINDVYIVNNNTTSLIVYYVTAK